MSDASPDALVYVAYARADIARVEPTVTALRERGYAVAFDAATVPGASNYVQETQQTLRRAHALIVFLSAAAAQSPWVESEARTYQSFMARERERALIAVRLDDTPLPPSLAGYTAVYGLSATPTDIAGAVAYLLDLALTAPSVDRGLPDEDENLTRGAQEIDDNIWVSRGVSDAPSLSGAESKRLSDYGADFGYADAPPLADMEFPSAAPEEVSPPATEPEPEVAASVEPAPSVAPAPAVAPQPSQTPQRGVTSGSLSPAPREQTPPQTEQPSGLERVTFTVYHPRETRPQQWQPMVVYLSLDDPGTMAQVAAYAAERLAGKLNQFRPSRSSQTAGLRRGAELRIVPSAPGFEFNPGYLDVTWREDVQQHEFRMCAVSAQPGQSVNGLVQFYQGLVLRAEVPISVFVGQAAARLDSPEAFQQAIARAYRRIFASYSHQDMPVVESCETAARSMGDQYLRDVSLLQAGQQWDPRLIQAINDADIFQLFWSKRAAASPFVEREWRHALMLLPTRPNFIRPVYWNRQLYPAPQELSHLHFQPLSLSSMGWSRLRTVLYEMRSR